MPHRDLPEPEDEVDRVFAALLRRLDAGEVVDLDSFLHEHPAVSGELRELLDSADLAERLARPKELPPGETDAPAAAPTAQSPPPTEIILDRTHTYVGRGRPSDRSHPAADADDLPRAFGEYQLLQELGRGGMGVVYKAHQTQLNRPVAVKMILSGHWASQLQIDRFYTEAKAAGKLSHPHIVKVYQVGEVDGHHFFSMEFVAGQSLSQLLQQGPLPAQRAGRYLRQIAAAVDYAHENHILHRDLKPSNILIDPHDVPKITDFGLARDIADDDARLTVTGAALGTPSYMSPEQALAKHDQVGRLSDVYSLGAMLYEMLTGEPPFSGESVADTILNVVHSEPIQPSAVDRNCDRDLEAICLKCLDKNPAARYASAAELVADLDRFLAGKHVRARRAGWQRRVWHWLREVPLVSAVLGRKVANATVWHRRLQATLLALPLLIAAVWLAQAWITDAVQYHHIDIGTGATFHTYHQLASDLQGPLAQLSGRQVVLNTRAGSVANRASLLSRADDLVVIQENVIAQADQAIQILAPLYYETILIIVRSDSGIDAIADLAGRAIAIGAEGSGMRESAKSILRRRSIDLSTLRRAASSWTELATDPELEGAIVTIKLDNAKLRALLQSGGFRLIPIPDAERLVPLTSTTIEIGEVPTEVELLESPLLTAQTMAVLAVRADAPNWFVRTCLQALYEESEIATHFNAVFTAREAANLNVNLHPAARRYFAQARR